MDISDKDFQDFFNAFKDRKGIMEIKPCDWWADTIVVIHSDEFDTSVLPNKYNQFYINGVNPYKDKMVLETQLKKFENRSLHSIDNPSINSLYYFVTAYESMINKYVSKKLSNM